MPIANGNTVRVHYTGTLADQTEFDTSRGREPLEFVMGKGSLIPGFEQALMGREKGDRFRVTIPAAEAYGEHLPDLIMEIPRSEVPDHICPEVGMTLQLGTDAGEMEVIVTDVTDSHVVLDANHPLAGEDLTFDIEVVAVCGAAAL